MEPARYLVPLQLAITLCFILNLSICLATPGIRVQITKKGLDYANDLSLKKMYEELKNHTFWTYSNGSFTFLNVSVRHVSMPTGDVSLVPGTGLRWSVGIQGYNISADVRYSKEILWVKMRKTFSLNVDIRSVALQVTLKATKTSNGGLSLKAGNCNINANIRVSSSNIILKIILRLFRSKIDKLIKKKLCDSAINIVNNNVAPKLSNFSLTRRIKHGYVFDYRLLSDPVLTPTYMQINHKAAVMTRNQNSNFPFSPSPLPIVNEDKSMLYFIISDFVSNTWLYTAHRDGILRLKVTKEKFKTEEQRKMFRTYCPKSFCVGSFFPQVSKNYSNGTVELTFDTSMKPTIQFTSNHIQLEIHVTLEFNVLTPGGKSVNFLLSKLVLYSALKADINGLNILFTVTNTTLFLGESSYLMRGGPGLDMNLERKFLNSVVQFLQGILPGMAFPLTVPTNTMLKNAKLEIAQNALIVSSDLVISSI